MREKDLAKRAPKTYEMGMESMLLKMLHFQGWRYGILEITFEHAPPATLGFFSSSRFTYHLEIESCRSREHRPEQPRTHIHAKALIRIVSPKTDAQDSHSELLCINV